MRLLFLGTGAAQGYPALFCDCHNCEAARRRGGRSLRRRAALLIDDELLVDFGPDLFDAALAYRLALYRVRFLLLTHSHGDHLDARNFDFHRPRWAQPDVPVMHVYGSAATLAAVRALPHDAAEMRIDLHAVAPGQTWEMGPYRVTALPARHAAEQEPLLYVIERGAAAVLYACDTGAFYPDTWRILEQLRDCGTRLAAAVIEGTMGLRDQPAEAAHLNLERCVAHHETLRRLGLTSPACVHLATHFSPGCRQFAEQPDIAAPYGTPLHEETEALLAPYGVEAAHDGLELVLDE